MPRLIAFTLTLLAALVARAETPTGLALPIGCEPGASCWVLRYVDHDPGPGARDHRCGPVTGDGHKGTDFAIRDLAAMAEGVEVRAAAAGVVEAVRDGMPDISVEETGREAVAGSECGNGIRIAHGDGWTTWYCHLRRGSLMVAQGERVEAGQPLALVGLSGNASFPHLHFDVRRGEQPIDPFVGLAREQDCGPGKEPLWQPEVMKLFDYRPVVLTNAGFATGRPEWQQARAGAYHPDRLPVSAPALVLWVEGFWVEQGDHVRFRITGPGGVAVLEHAVELEKGWKRWFQFAGAPPPGNTWPAGSNSGVPPPGDRWPAGTYTGEVTLERAGIEPVTIRRSVELQ